ncbi:hypothetical protein BIV57_14175 [Mangrovactinospora gilvigrisea]|uniref:DUF2550 domain-containing protein n=1 Tax=Mangrovactinospora gilvigrisea TaxID=1428644 RepID=A0A1J7CAY6_9ACTN|nr:DUF2550 domain-containing protein [Mangrovactinospora gilvigrisea]OIV36810.1 hypothetical protein BIV57_14175 [Mangrovactinospora gilvigrisea]
MILALVLCGAVVLAVLLGLFLLGVRRRVIQRRGGTFDCSLRRERAAAGAAAGAASGVAEGAAEEEPDGKGWTFGVARYSGDRLEWFRVFSYAPRPRRVLTRGDIEVTGRRVPQGQEEVALLSGAVVLECTSGGQAVELAMSEDALTGFLAWLEAAPPGQHVNVA